GPNSAKAPHAPAGLPALANDVSGDDPAHGAHTAHGQPDGSESASPKFADDGGTNSGKVPHDPPGLAALSSDVSGDDPGHGAHPGHGQADGSESASPKFADDGGTDSGRLAHDPAALTALPSAGSGDDSAQPGKKTQGHHASADPQINAVANNPPLQPPADNSLLAAAQQDDNGSPAVTDGAHPGHGQADGSESASPNFADDGSTDSGNVPDRQSAV